MTKWKDDQLEEGPSRRKITTKKEKIIENNTKDFGTCQSLKFPQDGLKSLHSMNGGWNGS